MPTKDPKYSESISPSVNDNLKKGIIFGIIAVITIGFQPIVANSRPMILDFYIFAAMTVIVEAILFFPLMLIDDLNISVDDIVDDLNNDDTIPPKTCPNCGEEL